LCGFSFVRVKNESELNAINGHGFDGFGGTAFIKH